MIRRSQVDFSISAAGCVTAALMVLILPLRWLAAVFFAAVFHEICHLFSLKLCKIPVYRIHIHMQGAVIDTAALSAVQELLCAAAGPMGSFLCLVFAGHFPMLALCGLLQGFYNLLPIYPLDGGRILRSITEILTPAYAETICKIVSLFTVVVLVAVCLYLYARTFISFFLLFAAYFPLSTALRRKTPCKAGRY